MPNTFVINLESYLADFYCAIERKKPRSLSAILYSYAKQIPKEFQYTAPKIKNKAQIRITVTGSYLQKNNCYFVPIEKQREFENMLKVIFNELFFNVIDITREYTNEQYTNLIEKFCQTYNLDFTRYFDMLKKKHYRSRLNIVK